MSLNHRDNEKQQDVIVVEPLVDYSLTVNLRLNFIRKVYSILSVQLFFTTLFTLWAYQNIAVQIFLTTKFVPLVLVFITLIVVMITLICFRSCARSFPRNYVLLGIFTACESYLVAVSCSIAFLEYSNGAQLVMVALGLTCALTISLTIYACFTKTDFTGWGIFLFMCVVCLFIFSFMMIFIQCKILEIFLCILVIIVYSLYLIFDTQLIMGGKRYELNMDDYVLGALILYVDIIMLFLELLKLLLLLFGEK